MVSDSPGDPSGGAPDPSSLPDFQAGQADAARSAAPSSAEGAVPVWQMPPPGQLPGAGAPAAQEPAPFPTAVPVPERRGMGPGWIAAIVAVVVVPVVGAVALGAMALMGLFVVFEGSEQETWSEQGWYDEEGVYTEGTVIDAATGAVVPGIGTGDRPAEVGAHTFTWRDESGGIVEVTVEDVVWDATDLVAAADPDNPPPAPGHVYVQAQLRIGYEGPASFDAFSSLWISAENEDAWSYYDEVTAEPGNPLRGQRLIRDGEEITAEVLFELPGGDRTQALIVVKPSFGMPLYACDV
ncbi:hypothetical protein [Brachybacterium hainanense]|uniref:DUF4352 domain-containing protein n=1 Tax=Brachybacterium hainanense TaxID=1541174 RepID=A0ABV6R940_9MICO